MGPAVLVLVGLFLLLLILSVKTVENHASTVMTRLAIHDRVELARYAIREGLVEA